MADWNDYIRITGGTLEEQQLLSEVMDKLWESKTMREGIQTLPDMHKQRMAEYGAIHERPYDAPQYERTTLILDDKEGNSSFPLKNSAYLSFSSTDALSYTDPNTHEVIQMSPVRSFGHEIVHLFNPEETPVHDFEVSKEALERVFGDEMSKQHPEIHVQIKDEVFDFSEAQTSTEV